MFDSFTLVIQSSNNLILFFLIPAIAAAINSVAGGGSFLTFPIFIMGGLSPLQANVMSTIALWPGAVASGFGYNSFGRQNLDIRNKKFLLLLIICVAGGVAGAFTLLHTPEVFFKKLVPWLLLGATLIFTFGKNLINHFHQRFPSNNFYHQIAFLLQLIISFYGGYFGAGIGILTLAMLQLVGMRDIHQMNATKVLLTVAINSATMLVFIVSDIMVWNLAAMMVAGGILGGYIGARLALKIPPQYVRILVSAIGFSMAMYFFAKDYF
jgi:uncharacterized membrane protein YfcA